MKKYKNNEDPFSFSKKDQNMINIKLALILIKSLYRDNKITKLEYEKSIENARHLIVPVI